MKNLSTLLLIGATMAMTACTTINSSSTIQKPYQTFSAYTIQDASMSKSNFNTLFEKELNKQLTKYGYKVGQGLNIKFDVQSLDKGNRALRYLVGFGAGKAKANVRVALTDENGNSLGDVDTNTTLYMGGLGGNADNMAKKAAKDIAKKIHETGILAK